MTALRARDAARAAQLALWHKLSVGDTVSTLLKADQPAEATRPTGATGATGAMA
jgi:hypothetical protein